MTKSGLMAVLAAVCAAVSAAEEPAEIRIGQFPNVTHAPALLARASGEFERALGIPVRWTTFNAGPSAVEALFAGAIDATYIGPNPAVNGFIKSQGRVFRVVAGCAAGGAALVVRTDAGIGSEKDFAGKTIATPQLGNTQDVAARAWFRRQGRRLKEKGGDLTILPLANPDQLLMMQKKEIHGAWTVEPWVSRLELEGGGKVFLEEGSLWPEGRYITAMLVVSRDFIEKYPDTVRALLRAHVEVTRRLNADKEAALPGLNAEIKRQTGKELREDVLRSALNRVTFTWDPLEKTIVKSAEDAHEAGFLKEKPALEGLCDLLLLNEALEEMGLPGIAP